MPLAALFERSAVEATAVLRLHAPAAAWRLRIELVLGWVHALAIEDAAPRDEDDEPRTEAELEKLVLGAHVVQRPRTAVMRAAQLFAAASRARFVLTVADEPRRRQGAVTPFHPLEALRSALEELFSSSAAFAEQLLYRGEPTLRTKSIAMTAPLHASALGPDERAVVALLSRPRTLEELVSRCAPPRLTLFLRDAVLLGAITLDGDKQLALELRALARDPGPAHAREEARRRAYHAEARALHPDLHNDGSADEQRARTQAMADLAAKHRRGE